MSIKELERILKALANKRRLAILQVIKNKEATTVADIARKIKLSFKATSKHLAILSSSDILEKEQRSLQVHHRIVSNLPTVVRPIIAML